MAEEKLQEKQARWQILREDEMCKAALDERRARAEERKAMAKLTA
jgi:hypothetical protein